MNPRSSAESAEVTTDVVVIGNGVIGLSIALEFARRGATCRVLGTVRPGAASGAAAGLLAPSIGRLSSAVRPFFYASLDRFPAYLETLQPVDPGLAMIEGLIELTDEEEQRYVPAHAAAIRLDGPGLTKLEPALVAQRGLLHPRDGAIDNVRLLRALRLSALVHPAITMHESHEVVSVDMTHNRGDVRLTDGTRHVGAWVVLSAGAWSPSIQGLPRALPVTPLKGQMLALRGGPLHHPVMGGGAYLVPRGADTVVGATTEHAGFDISTTGRAVASLRAAAVALCPALGLAPLDRAWAGIRPATPDMLPILGPDPDQPRLVYACGHSKNGILLAPATALAIAAGVTGSPSELSLQPFNVARFDSKGAES